MDLGMKFFITGINTKENFNRGNRMGKVPICGKISNSIRASFKTD